MFLGTAWALSPVTGFPPLRFQWIPTALRCRTSGQRGTGLGLPFLCRLTHPKCVHLKGWPGTSLSSKYCPSYCFPFPSSLVVLALSLRHFGYVGGRKRSDPSGREHGNSLWRIQLPHLRGSNIITYSSAHIFTLSPRTNISCLDLVISYLHGFLLWH